MTPKKHRWTWPRHDRKRHFESTSPLRQAVSQLLDKHHEGFKVLLETIDAVIQEGASCGCPTSSTIPTREDETNMTTTRRSGRRSMKDALKKYRWRHDKKRYFESSIHDGLTWLKKNEVLSENEAIMTTRQDWMAKVPRLPFWQHEPALVPIVKKLFDEQKLDDDELATLRAYMQSWITWTALVPEDLAYIALMEEIAVASQRHLMTKTIDRLLEYGIDPF